MDSAEIVKWFTETPPGPGCWMGWCEDPGDDEDLDGDLCQHLGWFQGRGYGYWSMSETEKHTVDWIQLAVSNSGSLAVHLGRLPIITLRVEAWKDGRGFLQALVDTEKPVKLDGPPGYFEQVWKVAVDTLWIPEIEARSREEEEDELRKADNKRRDKVKQERKSQSAMPDLPEPTAKAPRRGPAPPVPRKPAQAKPISMF